MAISSDAPVMTMPVAPTSANGGFGGFGGDGWWIILFFIVLFGWGGNGWGGNNGGVMDGYVLTSDFANIERKLDNVNNGLCDGFYAMNTGMLNGFAGVTQAVTNGFYASELSRCNQQAALMQQLNAMQMQAQECCCENRAAIAQVRYDMATQACDTRNTVQNATRDIIDNANSNSKAILDSSSTARCRICRPRTRISSLRLRRLRRTITSYLSCGLARLRLTSHVTLGLRLHPAGHAVAAHNKSHSLAFS